MKRTILVMFLIVSIAFNVQTSFGYSITFEYWDFKIEEIPTVCIVEPSYEDDIRLTEIFVERLMKETTRSIEEWEVRLKQSERTRDKSMWEINQITIPLEEQKEFNYQECTIFVHFRDKPELEDDWFKLLGKTSYEEGDTGRTEITIYYAEIIFCVTDDSKFIYYDPCYTDSRRLMQQLQSVIKHEFGHALGLGHYISDDNEVNVAWARGTITAPSIMAVFTHQNFNDNIIMPKDIDKVRTLYGEEGFLHSQTIEKNTFLSFESPQQEFIILEGEGEGQGLQVARIDGLINRERIISGVPVYLEITRPDGTSVSEQAVVNSDGEFSLHKILDSTTASGTYFVTASYRGEKSNEITFSIIKEETLNEPPQIPEWVRIDVSRYGNGDAGDENLIAVIEYLIEEGLMTTPDLPEQTKNHESKIPDWVKNNAKWWSDNQISNKEFINGMQFLIENGIIKI